MATEIGATCLLAEIARPSYFAVNSGLYPKSLKIRDGHGGTAATE